MSNVLTKEQVDAHRKLAAMGCDCAEWGHELCDSHEALRAERDAARSALAGMVCRLSEAAAEHGRKGGGDFTGVTLHLGSELAALRSQLFEAQSAVLREGLQAEAMRPVVEAAERWKDADGSAALIDALSAYRARQ